MFLKIGNRILPKKLKQFCPRCTCNFEVRNTTTMKARFINNQSSITILEFNVNYVNLRLLLL